MYMCFKCSGCLIRIPKLHTLTHNNSKGCLLFCTLIYNSDATDFCSDQCRVCSQICDNVIGYLNQSELNIWHQKENEML